MVRLLTQGPHSAPPQSGLHPEQRACQYPSTQPKITLPGLEKLVFFVREQKTQDESNAFQMQSGVALNDEPR